MAPSRVEPLLHSWNVIFQDFNFARIAFINISIKSRCWHFTDEQICIKRSDFCAICADWGLLFVSLMLLWLLGASLHCIKSPPSLGGISAYMQDECRDAKIGRYICAIFPPGGSNCLYYHARIVTRIVRYQHHTVTTAQCVLVESIISKRYEIPASKYLANIFLLQCYLFQKSTRDLVPMFPCFHVDAMINV